MIVRRAREAFASAAARTRAARSGIAVALAAALGLAPGGSPAAAKQVIVFGFDGPAAELVRELMDAGRLPNLQRLAKEGGFTPLGTSIPPQSPVAWSNFITGLDGGGHGIFDFIHRDPKTMIPYLSTSVPKEVDSDAKTIEIGPYVIPLSLGGDAGGYELLRHGTPFWETLEDHGVRTMIIRMPANFPVSGSASYEISGMGTPDVRGTYGSFSFWTTDRVTWPAKSVGGGQIYNVRIRNHKISARIEGPYNPLLKERARARADFEVHLDPDEPWALLRIGDEERVLRPGEWTDWVPIDLEFMSATVPGPGDGWKIPLNVVPVMCRFYLESLEPHFALYATPLDYDPMDPKIPISTPPSFAKEIAEANGRYYTEGMPEDTAALDAGVLTIAEFLEQAKLAGDDLLDEFPWFLDKFEREFEGDGLLFYYTGNQDQIGHMLYQMMDPDHPAYDPEVYAQYADVIPHVIEGLDALVGRTLDRLDDDTTLIVMSDHGFASWRREMNLNAWLRDAGFLAVKDPALDNDPGIFFNIDWSKTRAYGFGINSIYVNLRGREKNGIVDPADRRSLLEDIAYRMVKLVDPKTGDRAVTKCYIAEDAFHDRGYLDIGPDLIVGYAEGMRCSNQSAMGGVPREVFADNLDAWGADHCMDHETVPGVLLSNRPLRKAAPTLQSLAAAILAEFGVGGFAGDVETMKAVGYIAAER